MNPHTIHLVPGEDAAASVPELGTRALPTLLARLLGSIAAILNVLLAFMVLYEIVSRSVFGRPTAWVTEYSTYILIAITALGLSYAQYRRAHIQVDFLAEVLPAWLSEPMRRAAAWLTLYCLAFLTWQMAIHVVSERINDTRDWGLMATPQWIPQLPMLAGLAAFLVYFFWECLASSLRRSRPRKTLAIVLALATAAALLYLGRFPVRWPGTHLDIGAVLLTVSMVAIVFAVEEAKAAVVTIATLAAGIMSFWLVAGGSVVLVGTVIGLATIAALMMGMQIWAALGLIGLLGLYFLLPSPQIAAVAERTWSGLNSFTFTAVPLFVLMGNLLIRSGVGSMFYETLVRWFGWLPGGLGYSTIGAAGVFSALSGSTLATAATIGQVAGPEMTKRGYSKKLSYGTLAGGGVLGVLIPPSIPLIIYGATVGAPITTLFIAGIVPGLLVMGTMMVVILCWSLLVKGSAPATLRFSWRERISSLSSLLPFVIMIAAIFGSMYGGLVTATEAAAIGALMGAILCAFYGKLSFEAVKDAAVETVVITSTILFIVAGASVLSWVVDYAGVPQTLVRSMRESGLQAWQMIVLIGILYVVLGMFLDAISMMLMTLSVTFPIVMLAGYDAIWFGIALVMLIEVGLITPPVGMVLFVLKGTLPDASLNDITIGAIPFVFIILANVVLIAIFPEIVSWLPNLLEGGG